MIRIYATYTQWRQVSPDYDMEQNPRVMTITEETTVGEILRWRRQTQHGPDYVNVEIIVEEEG